MALQDNYDAIETAVAAGFNDLLESEAISRLRCGCEADWLALVGCLGLSDAEARKLLDLALLKRCQKKWQTGV